MSPVIPFRRRSRLPIVLGAIVAAVVACVATTTFLSWQSRPDANKSTDIQIIRPEVRQSGSIEVIDGDTVRSSGEVYRLVGFDTPERGDKARCDDERQRAEKATQRLRSLITAGNPRLSRVARACRPGEEGTSRCNYGRLCGVLTVGGRDVGQILIGEGLAHPYVCSGTSCPKRQPWCDGR